MQRYNLTATGNENVKLTSEERGHYMQRFGQSVVEFAQLEITQSVGEGT